MTEQTQSIADLEAVLPINSGLQPILDVIITSQTKGICQMQRLLGSIGGN